MLAQRSTSVISEYKRAIEQKYSYCRRGNHSWSGIEWWCRHCSSLPHLLIISTIATASTSNNSKTKKKSKIAGSYHDVISRRDAHPVREIKSVCHTLGMGVVFPQRRRGKGPLFWVIALSEICPVRWCSKGVLWWIFIWKRSERNAFRKINH